MKILDGLLRQAKLLTRGLNHSANTNGQSARPRRAGGVRGLFLRADEGGALVEMALTAPALLAIMTGLVTFGMAYSNQLTLTQAVGTGGQYLSQIRTSTTNPCADVFTAIKNAAPGLNSTNIAVTVTMDGVTPTQSGNSCSGSESDLVQGEPVTVYATYPCALSIYNVKVAGSCQLAAKVTEYEY
jgi:Flp pilus assembly protein TadG